MISRETGRTPDCHFEESRLSQVDIGPGDAIVEPGLSSAGEHLPSIGFCYIEMAGEGIFCLSLVVLHSIGCEFEQWQHEALKIRDFHYRASGFAFSFAPSTIPISSTVSP